MSGTINDAITGAVIGNVLGADRWLVYRNDSPETLHDDIREFIEKSIMLSAMSKIIRSIKKYDGFWIDDIAANLKTIDALCSSNLHCHTTPDDGSVLCWIYLVSFCDIFVGHDVFDDNVKQICKITHDNDTTINCCIEYCHLIHDIFCNHISQQGILELIPELDILAGDVPITRDARATFFAGLWAFVHSTSFESALDNCAELDHNKGFTNWIPTVAGTLAGLYFGADSIPEEMIKDFKFDEYLHDLKF